MERLFGIDFELSGYEEGTEAHLSSESPKNGVYYVGVTLRRKDKKVPRKISLRFKFPCVKAFSIWNPSCRFSRFLGPNWSPSRLESEAMRSAPIHSLITKGGRNCLTITVSDVIKPTAISTGYCEEDGMVDCTVEFFTRSIVSIESYKAVVRLDSRNIPFYQSITDARNWWTKTGRYQNAPVPENARLPVYSTWYSFHQDVNVDKIVEQCRLASQLGCKTVIVDDGWQTSNSARGYAYCGDWEVCPSKVPNMKDFVKRIHNLGMKFVLWYSVPFVGKHSKAWDRFEGKFLEEQKDIRILDPRFPEVRNYLAETYEKAMKEWDLDGFKLDFIDSFRLTSQSFSSPGDGRDFESLDEAVCELLREIITKIRAIKPDTLIEFRQGYIGPAMQSFGNMLRVGDCPGDALSNRTGSLDLRLTSGTTAVHSDMLTWNPDDSAEDAAMQLIAVLFCVPQISVLIDKLPKAQYDMLRFYLKFWKENRDVLLDGKLKLEDPEAEYGIVSAQKGEKLIAVAYNCPVLKLESASARTINLVNGTGKNELYVSSIKSLGTKEYTVMDCMGNIIKTGIVDVSRGIHVFNVPVSGILRIVG